MKLREYLDEYVINIKAWAYKNDLSDATVRNWLRGAYPCAMHREKIEQLTDGKVHKEKDWVDYGQKGKYDRRKRRSCTDAVLMSKRIDRKSVV